jgi:hypothetical protein
MENPTVDDLAVMAYHTLRTRASKAQERREVVKKAFEKSPKRLGQLVQRVNSLPGMTLEHVADILLEYGLEEF